MQSRCVNSSLYWWINFPFVLSIKFEWFILKIEELKFLIREWFLFTYAGKSPFDPIISKEYFSMIFCQQKRSRILIYSIASISSFSS